MDEILHSAHFSETPPTVFTGNGGGNKLFPVFLKMEHFDVLIVGGGNVGMEKITAVLGNSPDTRVTLVASSISDEIKAFAAEYPHVILQEKPFERADLIGKQFVIAATDDPVVNRQVKALAAARGILVNVADTPHLCDFYLSSIVQKGDLKIAISTNGKSPTIAKRLKETLNELLPGELNDILQHMPSIRQKLGGDFTEKVRSLNSLTASIAAGEEALTAVIPHQNLERIKDLRWRRLATAALAAFGLSLIFNVVSFYIPTHTWPEIIGRIDSQFWVFVGVGFVAQLADGLLGMGYGVVTQVFLMGAGVPLAAVSSSIHTAEVFTAGASGYSHYRFGNINRRLVKALLLPGVIGAIAGAALLAWLGDTYAAYIKPILAVYILLLGMRILSRAFVRYKKKNKARNIGWLAGAGGFLDSFGGGGWGPLVTSTLIAKGKTPQYVIGSVSLTEFFVTLASAVTFFSFIGLSHWTVIAGLILGGVAAAPLGARLAGKLPVRVMYILVGLIIIIWSGRVLWKAIPW
ncbi:MAG: TSUP family transporter [Bacteroidetes bacterium]|nr:TSUP family transporter [Bacteroidota bacterium]